MDGSSAGGLSIRGRLRYLRACPRRSHLPISVLCVVHRGPQAAWATRPWALAAAGSRALLLPAAGRCAPPRAGEEMPPKPWSHVRASTLWQNRRDDLSYREAHAQSCNSCGASYCCSMLALTKVTVATPSDVDYLGYLLNFDRVELGFSRDKGYRERGEVGVYLRSPCRHLDRESFGCGIHTTPQQPRTCIAYRAHTCWYRDAVGAQRRESFARVDRHCFEALRSDFVIDDKQQLLERPSWLRIREVVDADIRAAREAARDGRLALDGPAPRDETELPPVSLGADRGPDTRLAACQGCAASCCDTIAIPAGKPDRFMALDFLRYMLGFVGIGYVYTGTERNWILLRSRCRHLDAEARSCGVFGMPDRPDVCRTFDAASCSYRAWDEATAGGIVKLTYSDFEAFASCFTFDETRKVVDAPSVARVQERLGRPVSPAAPLSRPRFILPATPAGRIELSEPSQEVAS